MRSRIIDQVDLVSTYFEPRFHSTSFWQASEEVEEEINMGRNSLRKLGGATYQELRDATLDKCYFNRRGAS